MEKAVAADAPKVADPELRIDPLSGLRVIASGSRAARPGGHQLPDPPAAIDVATDPFAEGNESMTPPELWADRDHGEADTPGWRVRSVPNLYPALISRGLNDQSEAAGEKAGHSGGSQADGSSSLSDPLETDRGMPRMFSSAAAIGGHEVIVNSPRSVHSLGDLAPAELESAMRGWQLRMRSYADDPSIHYVHLIVNEGKSAGSSLPHTHAQLFALPFVPARVARERERFTAYHQQTQGRNLLEDLIAEEARAGERVIAVDDDAMLIAPFAAAVPYQMMIVPRRPRPLFEGDGTAAAPLLFEALARLRSVLGAVPPLNLWVRTAPRGSEIFCWRIDLLPRIGQPAGFELGIGVNLNSVPPETAAAHLREATPNA